MADVLGKKISELAETTDLAGLYTIGSDRNNQSKKVPLQFVKEAADYANAQGDYAKGVGDTIQGNTGVNEYPAFSSSTQYAAGSVVRYNDKLYRFTALHPAGAWVGTDAIETSIKAETDVKLTELESKVNDILELKSTIVDGTINSSGVIEIISQNRNLYIYPVLANQEIIVSNGDVYGWFSALPEVGSMAISGRVIENLYNKILSVPSDATYIAVRAEGTPKIHYNSNGVRQEIEKVRAELESIQIKPIDIEGHSKLLIGTTSTPLVGIDEVYGGEIELKNADNSKSEFYSGNTYYSICGLPKGTIINKVSLLAPKSNADSYLLIARFNGTTFETLAKLKLKSGNGESYLDNILGYECKEDVVVFANTFYYDALTTTDNVPYIYDIYTGKIQRGRVDLGISIKISIAGLVGRLESIDSKILNIDNSLLIQSIIVDGTLNSSGVIEIISQNRNLYIYPVLANQEIIVSSGDVYGWFSELPEVGSMAISGRVIENLYNKILSVPSDATYIAVRAVDRPSVKIKMSQPSLLEKIENLEQSDVLKIASDISMFEKIGFCGDSYMAGMIVVSENPSVTAENPNLAWGKILERTHGIKASLFARGGTSTIDLTPNAPNFLTEPRCLPALLAAEPQNLYVISLGHNDCYISANLNLYDKTWTKDEFIAEFKENYNSIITAIQNHAPNAKIIICQQSRPYALLGWGAEINVAIKEIAESHGLPYLNPEDDEYLSSDIYQKTMVNKHPTFAGYAGMAKAFDRLFCKATVDYWDYFKGYTGL